MNEAPRERRSFTVGSTCDSGSRRERTSALDHHVDQAVALRLGGREPAVALELALDALERLARVLAEQLEQLRAVVQDLSRLDLDVGRRAAAAAAATADAS